jgi:hypothetical protein
MGKTGTYITMLWSEKCYSEEMEKNRSGMPSKWVSFKGWLSSLGKEGGITGSVQKNGERDVTECHGSVSRSFIGTNVQTIPVKGVLTIFYF